MNYGERPSDRLRNVLVTPLTDSCLALLLETLDEMFFEIQDLKHAITIIKNGVCDPEGYQFMKQFDE